MFLKILSIRLKVLAVILVMEILFMLITDIVGSDIGKQALI